MCLRQLFTGKKESCFLIIMSSFFLQTLAGYQPERLSMNVICPGCKKEHIIEKSDDSPAIISCSCGEQISAEPTHHRRRVPSKRRLIQCSRCSRIYDPRELQDGKKICLTCGNLIIKDGGKSAVSRQKEERQESYYRSEVRALLEMCKIMSSSYERDIILSEIMKITTDILSAEGSSIILLDEEHDEMIFHVTAGEKSEELKKIRLKIGEGVAGHVFTIKTPIIVNSPQKDPHFCSKVDDLIKFFTRNLLCVPIFVGDRIIGVLEAVNKRDNGVFDEYDLKISEAIASQAGLAIEKARFIQENIKSERLVAIGQTISHLSYCIKNILTNLEGWAYNVDRAVKEKDYDNLTRGWDMVNMSITRISDLVRDMLLFSTETQQTLYPTNLNGMIEEIVNLLNEKAEKENVKIITNLDRSIKTVPLNAKDIYRCIHNIITNAIEACTPGKGDVEIHSTMNPNDRTIFVEVADNGQGIPPENLDSIFNVFFTTRGINHSGLGLSIARKIIEEHGGGIAVESQKEKGTRILLKIPVREEII